MFQMRARYLINAHYPICQSHQIIQGIHKINESQEARGGRRYVAIVVNIRSLLLTLTTMLAAIITDGPLPLRSPFLYLVAAVIIAVVWRVRNGVACFRIRTCRS